MCIRDSLQTLLSEDDVLMLMEKSVGEAVPALEKALTARAEAQKQRPTIKLAIKTDADPALVEIDGVLVGSTPIEQIDVYKGDHVLTVSKPGYQQITKRIQFDDSARIDVPMLREQMTAEEWAKIYEKASLKIIKADPGVIVNSWE